MRKTLAACVLSIAFAAPFVHAQSAEQIQQEIASLLAQISQLQALIQTVQGTTPASAPVGSAECPNITRNIGPGAEGSDVVALQTYLAADPTLYPEGKITGYYGDLTVRAVQRFQARVGAAYSGTPQTTGYGALGPKTRAALSNCEGLIQANIPYPTTPSNPSVPVIPTVPSIPLPNPTVPACPTAPAQPPAASCGNIWERVYENGCHTQWKCVPIPALSVTPNSGPSPLKVNAKFNIRAGDPYEINWGDGTTNTLVGSFVELDTLSKSTVILPDANQPITVPHTYTKQGTYDVNLRVGSYEADGDQWVWRIRRYAGKVTVSGSSVADSFEGVSVSGNAPFTASFKATINGSGSCDAAVYTLVFGNGTQQELSVAANECTHKIVSLSKSYAQAGFYTAKLYKGTPAQVTNNSAPLIGSVNVYATGGGSASGAFTASVGSTESTWNKVTVNFTIPTSEVCSAYELNWGDGSKESNTVSASTTPTCPTSVTTKTFTHTYSGEGTFTITLKRGVGDINTFPVETKTATTIRPN